MSKLQQLLIEERYNRKAIRSKVLEDISTSNLGSKYQAMLRGIQKYLDKEHSYDSKQERVNTIKSIPVEQLANEILVAIALSLEPQPIQGVASRLANHLPFAEHIDAVKTASELIAVGCDSDLYDIIAASDSETGSLMVVARFSLEEKTQAYMNRAKYLPPMVCKPNEITNKHNMDTSHVTYVDSLLLGREHHHGYHLCTDVINIANSIKLSLDEDILMFDEVPNKELDNPDKVKQFQQMAAESTEVYNEILNAGNEFYLTWKFDFRGRMYSSGYHITIQGSDYKKSLISLANKVLIT